MESTAAERWTVWLERQDERVFAGLVSPAIPHALAAARRSGLDEGLAEDAVQECLARLARERSLRPAEVGIIPWLVRAARLRARTILRSRARRTRRESHVPPAAPPRSAEDRAELADEVEHALAHLSEEEREVMLLRYLHDLDYEDIGTILSRSPGACRVRAHRARARLRALLGAHAGALLATLVLPAVHGEAALVSDALAAAGKGTGGVATLTGVLAMKTGTKLGLAAVVLLAAGVGIVGLLSLSRPDGEASPPGAQWATLTQENQTLAAEVTRLRAEAQERASEETPSAMEIEKLRRELADLRGKSHVLRDQPVGRESPPSPGRATDDVPPGTLRVRVLDEDGSPLENVRVYTKYEEEKEGRTSPEGILDLAGLAPGRRWVLIRDGERTSEAHVTLSPGEGRELAVTLVAGAAVVTGTVSDAAKGPLAGVNVTLHLHGGGQTQRFTGKTGPDGTYRIEGVPPGTCNITASSGPLPPGQVLIQKFEVGSGGVVVRDLVAGRVSLFGRVVDAETGEPVEGARVFWQGAPSREDETDSEGGYALADLMEGRGSVYVAVDGYGIEFRTVEVTDREQLLDFPLRRAAPIRVTVLTAAGAPYEGRVILSVRPKVEGVGTRVGTSLTTDAAGKGEYRQVVPGEYTLTFRVEGGGQAIREVTLPPTGLSLELTLEPR